MAAYRLVYDSRRLYRLTAKNRDQLRNPTLGSWATFTFDYTEADSGALAVRCVHVSVVVCIGEGLLQRFHRIVAVHVFFHALLRGHDPLM